MSVHEMPHLDLEQGTHHRSVAGSDISSFSDAENGSCYSQFYSTTAGSYDDYSFACVSEPEGINGVVSDSRRVSSVSDCSDSRRVSSVSDCSVEVEIENRVPEIKVHLSKVERDCRICHLDLESNSHESGVPIELGCSCKEDLAAAHKLCAEAWFTIKGNKTCEICHSIARNVVIASDIEAIEHPNETNNGLDTATAAVSASIPAAETRNFWQGHRFLNFLLACVVFAFVLSWLFHFNVPSS